MAASERTQQYSCWKDETVGGREQMNGYLNWMLGCYYCPICGLPPLVSHIRELFNTHTQLFVVNILSPLRPPLPSRIHYLMLMLLLMMTVDDGDDDDDCVFYAALVAIRRSVGHCV